MSGHVRQRGKKGQWYAVIEVSEGGKRKRRWLKLDGNYSEKREAQKACERLIAQQDDGTYVEPSKATVADFVRARISQWEASGEISARTAERHRQLLAHQIAPHLGTKVLRSYGHSTLKDGTRHCAILAGCEAAAVSPHKQSATRIGCYRKRFAIPYRSVPIHHNGRC
jgi:hypothetical protein